MSQGRLFSVLRLPTGCAHLFSHLFIHLHTNPVTVCPLAGAASRTCPFPVSTVHGHSCPPQRLMWEPAFPGSQLLCPMPDE
jgi:hypothetical protein